MTWDRVLELRVVYANPRDFPAHAVVRVQWVCRAPQRIEAAPVGCLYDTVAEAMADCAALGLTCLGRQVDDEPQIVAAWV